MTSSVIGQSVAVDEHKTRSGFEGELWIGLNTIVHARHMTMSELVFTIRSAAKATSPQPASPYSTTVTKWRPRNALRPQR
jgi:predicted DNA-binding ribbon-helix-helix protein